MKKYFLRSKLILFILLYSNLSRAFSLNYSNLNTQTFATDYYTVPKENSLFYSSYINQSNESVYSLLVGSNNNTQTLENYADTSSILHKIFMSLIFIPIMLSTLIGNMLVILAVIIVRKLHTQDNANNFLIVSLAVSDFLVGVLVMPFAYYVELSKDNQWFLDAILCDLWTVSDVLLCTASILNLCAISVDRYFIILHAMVYTQRRNAKLMFLMILIVWCLSAIISVPPIFGWGKPSSRLHIDKTCAVSSDLKYQIYATFFAFYLPLIVMIIIYINIYRAARKIKKREMETAGRLQNTADLNHRSQIEPLINAQSYHMNNNHNNNNNNYAYNGKNSYSDTSMLTASLINKNSIPNSNNLQVNPFDNHDKRPTSQQIIVTVKKSSSDSEQGSTESKIYHSSLSSQENVSSYNKDHHRNSSMLSPTLMIVSSSSAQGHGGSHVTINALNEARRNSFGRKFGRRLTQAFAGIKRNSGISNHGKNQKATRTLGVVMGCFILCWLPFFILAVVKPISLKNGHLVGDYIPRWLDSLLLWLGYFNSALNPVIYARFNREFRRPFIEILCFRCKGINEKLRDQERKKMYYESSHMHGSIAQLNNHRHNSSAANGVLSPSSASKNIINNENQVLAVSSERLNCNIEEKSMEKSSTPVKEIESKEPNESIDLETFKQQIEKDKNKFFFGTENPPALDHISILCNNLIDEKYDLTSKLNILNEAFNSKDENNNNTATIPKDELSSSTLHLSSVISSPVNEEKPLESSLELEKVDFTAPLKSRPDMVKLLNNSSTKSSLLTNDSANTFESTQSIFQPVEEPQSTNPPVQISSPKLENQISNSCIKINKNHSNDVVSSSIPYSSLYSFYSTAPTSPVNVVESPVVLSSNDSAHVDGQDEACDKCSNDLNNNSQVAQPSKYKNSTSLELNNNHRKTNHDYQTSTQRKLLNYSNLPKYKSFDQYTNSNQTTSFLTYTNSIKNKTSVPVAYCTYNKNNRRGGPGNGESSQSFKRNKFFRSIISNGSSINTKPPSTLPIVAQKDLVPAYTNGIPNESIDLEPENNLCMSKINKINSITLGSKSKTASETSV